MNKSYEKDKHIETTLSHIEEVLESDVIKALQVQCNKNKREMLLVIERAVKNTMKLRWMEGYGSKPDNDFRFQQMIYEERRMLPYVHPYFISSILQPIIGEYQNRYFNDYCQWSEAIVTIALNNMIRKELGMPLKEEPLND